MLGLGLMVRSLDFILSLRGSAGSPCRDLRGKYYGLFLKVGSCSQA